MKKILLLPFCLILFSCGYTSSQSISVDDGSTVEGVTQEQTVNGKSGAISMCRSGSGSFSQTQSTQHLLAVMQGEKLTLTNKTDDKLSMTINSKNLTISPNESKTFNSAGNSNGCVNIKY